MIKKIFILLLFSIQCFGATRYWVGGHPTNNNWNQTGSGTTNWSATSGGAAGASVPTSTDDVIFDGAGASGNTASTISATITVLSFTVTSGYTNTITHNAVLTVAGNVTLNTSYTIAGSSGMTISAASTITSNGKTWPNVMTWSGGGTKTISGNLTISGLLTVSTLMVLNQTGTDTLILAGGLTNSSGAMSGTARIKMTGGTWTGGATSAISNNLDFAGNITLGTNVGIGVLMTLTYISGTITTTGSTLTIGSNVTLNTNGITFDNITFNITATHTLNSLLTATGKVTVNAGVSPTFAGSYGFNVANLIINNVNAQTVTLNDAATYTITTSLQGYKSRNAASLLITSDHATNKAALTLNQGATCNLLADMTRIDASGGRTIRTFNGTVTSCTNVQEFHDLQTIGF